MIVDDFNENAFLDEKKGGAPIDIHKSHVFGKWIDDCGLLDLGYQGLRFTWRNPL